MIDISGIIDKIGGTRLKIAIGALIVISLGVAVWSIHHAGYEAGKLEVQSAWKADIDAKALAAAADREARQAETDKIAQDAAAEAERLRQENDDLREKVKNETKRNPIYTNCIVPVDGVLLYNAAICAGKKGQGSCPADAAATGTKAPAKR